MELQSVYRAVDEDRATFDIAIPAEDASTLIDQFTISLAYQNDIAPEAGQSIEDAIASKLGKEELERRVKASVMEYAFPFAAESAGVLIVGRPAFSAAGNLERGKGFSFEALCTLKPSISLSSYEPVEITVPPLDVTDEDVENYLDGLARSHAHLEEDAGHADIRRGDQVELAIETFKDGARCDQLCSEGRTYTTGADLMPAGFDDEVMGMRVGETKTISYECPGFALGEGLPPETERYTSTVTAKRIQKTVVPELDDDWIRENLPEFDGLDSLKEHVRATISERKSAEYRHYRNLQSANELLKRFDGEISEAVRQAVTDDVVRSFDGQLVQQGTTREEFLRQQGITEQQLLAHLAGQVREQLARQLSLDAVAEHFGLELGEEDLDEYFRAAASPGLEAMMRADFERSGRMPEARLLALRLKANDYLTEHAVVHVS